MSIDRYRPIAALVLMLVLFATNASYLVAYNNGPEAVSAYASKWDMPQVKMLNLLLVGLLVALAAFKPKEAEEEA